MIRFVIKNPDKAREKLTINLNARRAVDGGVIIHDHPLIDIAILTEQMKVVSFPKREVTDEAYEAQHRLFKHLRRKGCILFDSIQGGNIFGAIEATYPESAAGNTAGTPAQFALFNIARFMENEMPTLKFIKAYEDSLIKSLVDPSVEDSTELGEIPHKKEAGSLNTIISPYGTPYRAYE